MADPSDEPPIEILTPDRESPAEQTITGTGLSARWLVFVGVALALVGFLVVTADDDPATDGAAADEVPSTSPDTTAPDASAPDTSRPVTPSGAAPDPVTVAPGRDGPILGRGFDAALLLGGEEGWWLVDLTANSARPVPALDGVPARALVPVRGGVARVDPVDAVPQVLSLTSGDDDSGSEWRRLDAGAAGDGLAGPAVMLLAGDSSDEVWVVHASPRPEAGGLRATLFGPEGDIRAGPIDVPGTPVAATSRSIVFDAGGRSYLAGVDGTGDLGPGTTYDAAGGLVARVVCDAEATCAVESHEIGSGSRRAGPVIGTDVASDERITLVVSPRGDLVTVPGFRPAEIPGFTPAVTLRITSSDSEPAAIDVPSIRSAPVWLPDGESLLVLTNIGLQHISVEDGLLAGRRIDGVDIGGATDVLVIPNGATASGAP